MSPFFLVAQNTSTEKLMEELGYQKVNLNELKKEQLAQKKTCSTCPNQAKTTLAPNPSLNVQHEIQKLKNQLPKIEQMAKDAKNDPNMAPSMQQKYQTALKNTKERIKSLEQELSSVH